jgi:tRNA-splicing endonuclease subunit Sen54
MISSITYTSPRHHSKRHLHRPQISAWLLLSGSDNIHSGRVTDDEYSARMTSLPTLFDLDRLYEQLPVSPPPTRRLRKPPTATPDTEKTDLNHRVSNGAFQYLYGLLSKSVLRLPFLSSSKTSHSSKQSYNNPFMLLRQGNKIIVIAAVDAGLISFYQFGQGTFEDWPMV